MQCPQVLWGARFFVKSYTAVKLEEKEEDSRFIYILAAMPDGGVSTVAPGNVIRKVPGIGVATLRAIKSAPSAFVVPCKNEESSMLVPSAVTTNSVMPLAELMNGRAEHEENGGGKRGGIDDPLTAAAAAEASTDGSIVIPLMTGDHKQPNRIAKPKSTKVRRFAKWLLHS